MQAKILDLSIFNCNLHIQCESLQLARLLHKIYGAMEIKQQLSNTALNYVVGQQKSGEESYFISTGEGICEYFSTIADFLFSFEKIITIDLQKIRSDLYFIHAASLEYDHKGIIISAPSGTGKSTTAWALLHGNFNYLSDELAPIDLNTMELLPYPHAICLKNKPPQFSLPDGYIDTSRTLHIPYDVLPGKISAKPVPLTALFFLSYAPDLEQPVIRPISSAIASAKLYSNSLNALAHDDKGLNAAIAIASQVKCFDLFTTQDLHIIKNLITCTLDSLADN